MNKKFVLVLAVIFSSSLHATDYEFPGKIIHIQQQATSTLPSSELGILYIDPDTTTAIGTCSMSSGNIFLYIKNNADGNRQIALSLAAHLTNKTINIKVDDSMKVPNSNNACFVTSISL